MPQQKQMLDRLSIYIPQKKMEEKPVERLISLGKKRDRSVNYLVVEAILQYRRTRGRLVTPVRRREHSGRRHSA